MFSPESLCVCSRRVLSFIVPFCKNVTRSPNLGTTETWLDDSVPWRPSVHLQPVLTGGHYPPPYNSCDT